MPFELAGGSSYRESTVYSCPKFERDILTDVLKSCGRSSPFGPAQYCSYYA